MQESDKVTYVTKMSLLICAKNDLYRGESGSSETG